MGTEGNTFIGGMQETEGGEGSVFSQLGSKVVPR